MFSDNIYQECFFKFAAMKSGTESDIIPFKDSICAEWEDQLEDYASKNFSELQIEIMKPKLIDAPYQHNCELADEYSVLSNRTGCIRKSVKSQF